ncbi:phage tail tape measure protein [Streptomyces fumanus]|uniref:phage tail tape measure protein n=1 Tax=Streptomyces fumanus TaxID=67302 RepID=UPI0033CAC356
MALQVGELTAILSIDDRAVAPALRRAERALRQAGRRMGADAEDDGEQTGQRLGEGLVRGADGQWRNMRGELVDAVTAAAAEAEAEAHRAGRRVGQRLADGAEDGGQQAGDALADGVGEGADGAVDQAGSKMERLKQVAGGAAMAAGAAAGALLMSAMTDAMDQSRIVGRLGAQLGATGPEAQRYGKIAGKLYADAITEDFQTAADTIQGVMRAGLLPPDATNRQIEQISTRLADVASLMEEDVGQAARAVGKMIKTGLADNAEEALDILARGVQSGANEAEDLLDTFSEYSTQFRNMGLSGKQATGLIAQGLKAGARDADVVADTVKEFSIEAVAGGERVRKGFKSLGLSADDMVATFAKGGPKAADAFDLVLDKLRGIEDPAKRNAVAIELFGTKAEDLGESLYSLDPSEAVKALGDVGGAADKMGNALRDNAGTRVEQFKRGLQQNLISFLGGTVIPAFTRLRRAIGGIWDEAGQGGVEGADRIVRVADMLVERMGQRLLDFAPKAIYYLQQAGARFAAYIQANPVAVFKIAVIAAALVAALGTLPLLVAGAFVAAGTTMVVGFVNHMIASLQQNIPRWWNGFVGWVNRQAGKAAAVFSVVGTAISAWFSGLWSKYISQPVGRAWTSFITSVHQLPGRASNALAGLGTAIVKRANTAWVSFRNESVRQASSMLTWVQGLPSRISNALGGMSSLLVNHGRNVVYGLWNGIQSMGGWIAGQLMSWARSVIPGPIARALGIASPSKVTKAQGRWIARGLIDGLTGSSKQVRAAATKLADIVRDSMKPGKGRSQALATISRGTSQLTKLADKEARLADKLKAATKKLADQIKARDKLAADVKKGVLDEANITQQDTGGWPQTADSILAGLRQDTAAAQAFAKNLDKLRKKGVRADLIAQIAQAGVEQGSSAAAALANADSSQIKEINKQQSALVKAAGAAGTTAGDAMYGAGIQAAKGLVKGLSAQKKAVEKQMLAIAKAMSKAIKKALGIKSPSRVMAEVGAYTAQGLVEGVESERSAVNASMASLVETPAPGSWDTASARARAAAANRTVIEIRSSGRAEDEYLMERLRRGVRKRGGGDVDLVLAGRRSG